MVGAFVQFGEKLSLKVTDYPARSEHSCSKQSSLLSLFVGFLFLFFLGFLLLMHTEFVPLEQRLWMTPISSWVGGPA